MKRTYMPTTLAGKWSAGLQAFFLAAVIVSVLLVNGFHILSYGSRWWDVTVGVIFPVSIIAFITGIVAMAKGKDRSILVFLSVIIGVLVILFILLHSLFLPD